MEQIMEEYGIGILLFIVGGSVLQMFQVIIGLL